MKKLLLVLLFAGGAAGAWWWWSQRAAGEVPPVADTLQAEHTILFASAPAVDGAARVLVEALEALPEADRAGPIKTLTDSAARAAMLGFDPVTAAGWAEIGVDPAAGLSVVLDRRVAAEGELAPVALLRVTDRDRLLGFFEGRLGSRPTIEAKGSLEQLVLGGRSMMMGPRQGYTAVLLGPERVQLKAMEGFSAFLADPAGDLPAAGALRRAFSGAEGLRFGLYLSGEGALNYARSSAAGLPEFMAATAQHYVERFPGLAVWIGDARSGGRLVATDAGHQLITQLMVPAKGPPKFSRHLPAGSGAVRLSVNLKDGLKGIADALPPVGPLSEAKSQLDMAPMFLPMVLGFGQDDLAAAFSGHVALTLDAKSVGAAMALGPAGLSGLTLIGINEAERADRLVPGLLKLVAKVAPGATAEEVSFGGRPGHRLKALGLSLAVVRLDEVLVAGPEAVVEAALAGKASKPSAAAAAALDGRDVVFGLALDPQALAGALPTGLLKLLERAPLAAAVEHDRHGLFVRSEALGIRSLAALFVGGALAWFDPVDASGAP